MILIRLLCVGLITMVPTVGICLDPPDKVELGGQTYLGFSGNYPPEWPYNLSLPDSVYILDSPDIEIVNSERIPHIHYLVHAITRSNIQSLSRLMYHQFDSHYWTSQVTVSYPDGRVLTSYSLDTESTSEACSVSFDFFNTTGVNGSARECEIDIFTDEANDAYQHIVIRVVEHSPESTLFCPL